MYQTVSNIITTATSQFSYYDLPTGSLDSVFYTESSVDFYECNFFERYSFSFQPSRTDSWKIQLQIDSSKIVLRKKKIYDEKNEKMSINLENGTIDKKRLGKDAKVSVLFGYLHPPRLISSTLPNIEINHRLEDCIVVRMVVKKVNWCDQLVVVLKHDSFKTHDGHIHCT